MEAALNGPQGRTILGPTPLKLGRAQDNDVVVSDNQASSHHAEITPGPGGTNYVVVDLGSTNGTFVNEQRIAPQTPHPLRGGDFIRIGGTSFAFEIAGSVEATVRASSPALDATVIGPLSSSTPSPSSPEHQPPSAPPSVPPTTYGASPEQSDYPPLTPSAPAYVQGYPNYQEQPGYNTPQPGFAQQPAPGYPQQPAPGYPQAPAFGVPGTAGAPQFQAPPKKTNPALWIGLVVVAVLIIGGVVFVLNMNSSTPQKTLEAACTALKNGDAQGFYNQLSAASQKKTSVKELQQGFAFFAIAGGIKSCSYQNVVVNGSTATAEMTLEFGNPEANEGNEPGKANLVNEGGTWKLVSDDTLDTDV